MRILIILKYIPSRVSDRKGDAIISTIRAHEKAGYDVVLLTTGKEEDHAWESINVKPGILQRVLLTFITLFFPGKTKTYRELIITKAVEKYHKEHKIDAIFAYCTANHPAIHAAAVKSRLGIPFVVREHKIYEKDVRSINDLAKPYQDALADADKVMAVSPQLADIMMNIDVKDEVGYLPNIISDAFFERPKDLGVFKDWVGDNFLFAGWTRWREFKRPDLLVQAFAEVCACIQNVRLVLAGAIESDEHKKMIELLIKEQGLEEYVWLYGDATRQEIHQLAHSCDCCVVPSDFETFGLPALEAIAAGRPVVTTRCGGPESIITSDNLGRVVEKGNKDALVQAMIEIVNNREHINSDEIIRYAREHYSLDTLSRKLKSMYSKVIS
jgi:glycosyltransferase involved in cell wall biosynthesis